MHNYQLHPFGPRREVVAGRQVALEVPIHDAQHADVLVGVVVEVDHQGLLRLGRLAGDEGVTLRPLRRRQPIGTVRPHFKNRTNTTEQNRCSMAYFSHSMLTS